MWTWFPGRHIQQHPSEGGHLLCPNSISSVCALPSPARNESTSTGLYRSCAALASFSGTFDLVLFQALNIEFIFEKVWFGLVSIDGLNKQTKQMVFGLL